IALWSRRHFLPGRAGQFFGFMKRKRPVQLLLIVLDFISRIRVLRPLGIERQILIELVYMLSVGVAFSVSVSFSVPTGKCIALISKRVCRQRDVTALGHGLTGHIARAAVCIVSDVYEL